MQLVGRRGPAQAKFTTKELRGLTTIRGCEVTVDRTLKGEACRLELADKRNLNASKNVELLDAVAARPDADRRLALRFLLEPEAIIGAARVERIVFRRTRLGGPPFAQCATATEERVAIECGLVLTSIGYRGHPIKGVAFDEERGVVPNENGMVASGDAAADPLYVTGWLKRGPTGIIGTNRADSIETVRQMLAHLRGRKPPAGRRAIHASLPSGAVVNAQGWAHIDEAERAKGIRAGKPREKFVRVADMLDCLGNAASTGTSKPFGTGPAMEASVAGRS